jgi:amino acid adenylation domain-containing protein
MTLPVETQSKVTAVDFNPFANGELLLTVPTTESQKEIWASVQMGREANCAYNESQTLRLKGLLDEKALRSALQQMILRHEALRTTFSPDGSTLCIVESLNLEIQEIDLSGLDVQNRETSVENLQQQAVQEPFDLEHGPLFRTQIVKLQSLEHLLIVTAHHIICDGWSWAVLMPDLGNLYSAIKQGRIPELEEVERFSDYAIALEAEAESEETVETENYWLHQFSGDIPIVDFPTDRPRPPLRTFNAAREDWDLSPALVTNLKQLGTNLNCSFMTALLAGFEVWLHRITGQDNLVVGVLAAGQASSGSYNLVGHCVNLLPLRSQVDSRKSFSDYLQSRRSTVLDAYDHQQFTFGSLVQKLSIPRDSSRIPLAPILLNIDQGLDSSKLPFDGLEVQLFSNPRSYENFELFVNATELAGRLTLECQYNTNLFDAETIRCRMAELETLLEGIVADPNRLISTLPLLPISEQQLLAKWNETRTAFPCDICIHQLVEVQVEKTPNAIAVVFEDRQLTYQELDYRANQLARHLQTLGVRPEVLVGISQERTTDLLVAMLGVLKAGGAYVPLDPAYPGERLAFMLEDAQVAILLTQQHLADQLPQTQAQMVCLDRDWNAIAQHPSSKPSNPATSENLAYVIYTSGSTGKPKGVQVPHRSVVNFLTTMQEKPGMVAGDMLLSVTTLSFDIAVLELLLPLTVGATTVLASRQVTMDGEALLKLLQSSEITVMQATPATWRLLLASGWTGSPHLKILCGGEALPPSLTKELSQRAQSVWNMYGPTETTIWSTCYQIEGDNAKPLIGKPIGNTQVYILDDHQQPVPVGVPGEMYISGAGVVRGYLNRPELTAERFVPDPFTESQNARMYRTGDLARFLPNGYIEYLQRTDNQVKFRGFRIELGEIETTITQYPAVKEAVVIVREDILDDKTLVGYVVLATNIDPEQHIPQLRQFLKGKLPDYMVPSVLVELEKMPLTPNGKIEHKALPKPDATRQLTEKYVAPRTEIEKQIVDIWTQVINLEQVGIHDNFFDLGGYSLLAIQVIARLRKAFQVEILLSNLFELQTVAELANRVETLHWAAQGRQIAQSSLSDDDEEGEI